ncbi:MAG: VCBS repeat-containing protein [Tidjanibacter sp.]|nr:VCBS repeat-containing protein [Tidjanibacter sp.]
MKRRLLVAICMLVGVFAVDVNAQTTLKTGKPLLGGGEKHLAPLALPFVYNQYPVGYAYLEGRDKPSLFLASKAGMSGARGLFVADYLYTTEEGNPVFSKPRKIKCCWGTPKNMPTHGCVFNLYGEVYSVWRETKSKLFVARYDEGSNTLERMGVLESEGLSHKINVAATPLADGSVEIAVAYEDGSIYRPEGYDGVESYYDGAGIYRGELPYGGVIRFILRNFDEQVVGEKLTSKKHMLAMTAVARVNHSGNKYGYVAVNRIGALMYVDPRNPEEPRYVWGFDDQPMDYGREGGRIISFPDAEGNPTGFVVGGEGVFEYYGYLGPHPKGVLYDEPRTLLMENGHIYSGTLGVPNVVDWDGDGVLDIVSGNSEGEFLFWKNRGTDVTPDFHWKGEMLQAGGRNLVVKPGYYDIQGPMEASWGYTAPTVFDWNGDGLLDIVWSDATASFYVALNTGTKGAPTLALPEKIHLDGLPLWGTWRVKPALARVGDRVAMMIFDEDDALHLYWRVSDTRVYDGGKVLLDTGGQITSHSARTPRLGSWGRCKLSLIDWDGDGLLDLLIGTPRSASIPTPERGFPNGTLKSYEGLQVLLMKNVGSNEKPVYQEPVQFQINGKDTYIGQHANSPTPCMLGDTSKGVNLLVGSESGRFFFYNRADLTTITIDERNQQQK